MLFLAGAAWNQCLVALIALLAVGGNNRHKNRNKSTTWFIDGSNVLGSKGTPRDKSTIVEKLQPIRDVDIVLVFDGNVENKMEGDRKEIDIHANLETVQLAAANGVSADDYIIDQIVELQNGPQDRDIAVKVVTADRELRRRVLKHRMVKTVVNPVVFWKRYRPRLGGLKAKVVDADAEESPTSPAAVE